MQPDGAWRLLLHRPGEAPEVDTLPPDEVAALCASAARLPLTPPAVLTPAAAQTWTRREQEVGGALARALAARASLWASLWRHLGAAWDRGEIAVLAISAQDPIARALPWELLAAGPDKPPLASTHPFQVVRLSAGQVTARPSAACLRLVIWAPDPSDPTVQTSIQNRINLAQRLQIPALACAGADLQDLPPPRPGEQDLLCVIAHGQAGLRQVELLLPQGPVPPQDPAHALSRLLGGALAVVLEVCDADASAPAPLDTLAGRLVYAGAAVVLAPRRPWLAASFDALLGALLPALLGGAPVAQATRAGLAAVAGLCLAHPGARPWTLSVGLGHVSALHAGLSSTAWAGAAPGPEGARLLALAEAQARRAGHGFLGLEHLALAQLDLDEGGPVTARARTALWWQRERIIASLSLLSPAPGTTPPPSSPAPSPRLRRLGELLPPGWDTDALWAALAQDPGVPLSGLRAALDPPDGASRTPFSRSHAGTDGMWGVDPPEILEVQGGPEDGRRLRLSAGETVGRWYAAGPWPAHALYRDTALTDERLSRLALRWCGPGRLELDQRGAQRLLGGLVAQPAAGPTALAEGDVLLLGRTTRLLARAG